MYKVKFISGDTMRLRCGWLSLLLVLIAGVLCQSCHRELIFPTASGRPYEVLVVLDAKVISVLVLAEN